MVPGYPLSMVHSTPMYPGTHPCTHPYPYTQHVSAGRAATPRVFTRLLLIYTKYKCFWQFCTVLDFLRDLGRARARVIKDARAEWSRTRASPSIIAGFRDFLIYDEPHRRGVNGGEVLHKSVTFLAVLSRYWPFLAVFGVSSPDMPLYATLFCYTGFLDLTEFMVFSGFDKTAKTFCQNG